MKIYNFHLTLLVISVDFSLALYQTDEASSKCPRNLPSTSLMTHFHDSCYQFVSEEKYWHDARNFCLEHRGRLVKIDDPQTNEFIVGQLNSLWWRNNGVWIGLHDIGSELQWHWTGFELHHNEEVLWTNWGRGHPGAFFHNQRDCVRMVRSDGWKWHETVCNALRWHYRFICEYRMLNTSGSHAVSGNVRLHRAPDLLNRESSNLDGRLMGNGNVLGASWYSSEDEAAAAVQLNDQKTANGNGIHSPTAVLIAVSCILVGTLILVAIFMINRRRLKLSTKPELDLVGNGVGSKVEVLDDGLTEASSFRPSAIANIYVDADVKGHHVTSRLAFKTNPEANRSDSSYQMDEDDRSRSPVKEMESHGDGKEEENEIKYDSPKSINIYSEISDENEDGCTDDGHIYEALEDVRKYSEKCA